MTLVAPLPATEVTVSGEEPSATDEPKAVEEQAQEQELPVDENQPVAPQQGKNAISVRKGLFIRLVLPYRA